MEVNPGDNITPPTDPGVPKNPETDREPMAENTTQYRWTVTITEGLDG